MTILVLPLEIFTFFYLRTLCSGKVSYNRICWDFTYQKVSYLCHHGSIVSLLVLLMFNIQNLKWAIETWDFYVFCTSVLLYCTKCGSFSNSYRDVQQQWDKSWKQQLWDAFDQKKYFIWKISLRNSAHLVNVQIYPLLHSSNI